MGSTGQVRRMGEWDGNQLAYSLSVLTSPRPMKVQGRYAESSLSGNPGPVNARLASYCPILPSVSSASTVPSVPCQTYVGLIHPSACRAVVPPTRDGGGLRRRFAPSLLGHGLRMKGEAGEKAK